MTKATCATISIKAKDGYALTASHWQQGKSKGIIAFNAGTCVKRDFYQQLAVWLFEHNYDVLTYDYRGVGDSRPVNLRGFKASIIDWGTKDISGVIDWMVQNYPQQKKFMIGHSMGGQVIGLAPNINQLDKLISVVASYGNWQNYASPRKYRTGISWATIFPFSVLRYGYFPAGKFNLGEDWPKGVTWDWWSWGIRRIPHSKIMDNRKIPHFYKKTTIPIIAYFMSDDLIATAKTIPHYKTDFSNAELMVKILKPADYGVEKIGHMGMFTKKCEKVWWEILADLEKG